MDSVRGAPGFSGEVCVSEAPQTAVIVKFIRAAIVVLCAGISALGFSEQAHAHTTMCDLKSAIRFGYGTKIEAIVWAPRYKGDTFRAGVDAFFERSGYSLSAVGSLNSDNVQTSWSQLPQSESLDIAFAIRTTNDRDFATVSLSTFSFDCGATEDWRPHWRRFRNHLQTSEFNTFIAWRPLLPEASQIVGGEFNTPIWLVYFDAIVDAIAAPLTILGSQRP